MGGEGKIGGGEDQHRFDLLRLERLGIGWWDHDVCVCVCMTDGLVLGAESSVAMPRRACRVCGVPRWFLCSRGLKASGGSWV